MKIRTLIFLFVIVGIIGTAFYFYKQGSFFDNQEDIEMLRSKTKGVIDSPSNWHSLLIGKWTYKYHEANNSYTIVHEGDIELKDDGTFSLYVSIRQYALGSLSDYDDYKAGGSIVGKWQVYEKDQILFLDYEKFNISVSESIYKTKSTTIIDNYNSRKKIGNAALDFSKSEVREFNKDQIFISGKYFPTGADFYYLFTKSKKKD